MDRRPIRVLLIEDNPGDARLVREMLAEAEGQRFEVECCDRLSAGLACLAGGNTDVILADLGLPDSQGLDSFVRVRTEAEVPVVVLTSLKDETVGAEAVQAGAQDYLVKGQVTSCLLARTLLYSIERFRTQKKVEKYAWELQLAERRFRMMIQRNADGIVIVGKSGIVQFVNPSAEYMFNRKANELVGEVFPFPLVVGEMTALDIARSDGETVIAEMRVVETEWEGETAYLASLRDVTERKRAEEELRESEEKLRLMFESVADGIIVTGLDGNILQVNDAALRMHKYDNKEELIGRKVLELIAEVDHARANEDFERTINKGCVKNVDYAFLTKKGKQFPAELSAAVLRNGSGNPIGFIAITRDITERKKVEEARQQGFSRLQRTLGQTVNALASLVETRDPYTAGHQRRVTQLACAIAQEMGLSDGQVEGIWVAGLIHDIGKISIPAELLSKPSKLDEAEMSFIRNHPKIGYEILKDIEFPWPVTQIVLQHHERMNGSGYPRGLAGKDILLEARILGLSDVVEAISSHRPYRPALGIDKALDEILQNRGILYDAVVVDICLRLFTEKRFDFEQGAGLQHPPACKSPLCTVAKN